MSKILYMSSGLGFIRPSRKDYKEIKEHQTTLVPLKCATATEVGQHQCTMSHLENYKYLLCVS